MTRVLGRVLCGALVLLLGCGQADGSGQNTGGPDDAGVGADSGTDGSRPDGGSPDSEPPGDSGPGEHPPPDGGDGPVVACEGPRAEPGAAVRVLALASDHCQHSASEGSILAIESDPSSDGVSFVLHEGFDGGDTPHCRVTVENVGAGIADKLSWAVGTIYAAYMAPGSPGAFWIADGVNFWSCDNGSDGFSGYPLVLWAGGDPELTPPIYPGYGVEPDWQGTGCSRPVGECTDYDRGYQLGMFDRNCQVLGPATASAGQPATLQRDGRTQHFQVLRNWQELDCPLPGNDDLVTADFPPGSWLMWSE